MKSLFVAGLVILMGSVSFADQCAYISKDKAEKAVKVLLDAQKIQSLCEPCGDSEATTVKASAIGLRKAGYGSYWEVVVNNQGIDLAYTYVNGLNLAKIVACPADGVSPAIK